MTDDEDVLAANESFYAAFAAKDFDIMDRLWAESVPVTCVHPGWALLSGRDDVLGSWRAILSNPAQPRIVSGGAGVRMVGDIAVVVCRELVAGNPLLATNVFERRGSGWRMVHHHASHILGGSPREA